MAPPNDRLKMTCRRSPLPTRVTLWRRNQAIPAARSADDTQLSREPLGGLAPWKHVRFRSRGGRSSAHPLPPSPTILIVGAWFFYQPALYVLGVVAFVWITCSTVFTFRSIRGHSLRVSDSHVTEIDEFGRDLDSIDLSRFFTYEFLYRGEGNAVYRLRQGKARVDFGSEVPEAKHLVRDIMGLEWPPRDKALPSA